MNSDLWRREWENTALYFSRHHGNFHIFKEVVKRNNHLLPTECDKSKSHCKMRLYSRVCFAIGYILQTYLENYSH